VQYDLDEQFAYNIEESICRRGEAPPMSSPTPASRPKRATRALVRFNGIVAKEKRIRGREDRYDYYLYARSTSFTLFIY
jgi:hypothetical protein